MFLMKIKKRYLIIGVVVIIAAAGIVKVKMAGGNVKGLTVTTSPVEKEDIKETLSLKAPLEGTQSIEIASNLDYEIMKINVKEGDRVKKGQVLAVLDKESILDEIQTQKDNIQSQREQLSEKLDTSQKALDTAKISLKEKIKDKQHDYEKALNDLNEAQRKYNNIKALYENGAESKEDFLEAEKTLNDCKTTVDSYNVKDGKVVPEESELRDIDEAQTGVNVKGGKVYALDSDLTSIASAENDLKIKEKSLNDCEIKSTIDGTVTRVNTKVGRLADETDDDKPMFVIENIDHLQMNVNVSEYDIDKVKVGQKVEVKANVLKDDAVKGTVSRISPTGESKNTSTSERVIPVQIDVNHDDRLISGINATADILVAESKNALCVPLEALYEDENGNNFVFRVNDGNVTEKIPVKTGVENDLEAEVISDKLSAGDNIVLSPESDMPDGTQVMPSASGV
jgi:RND family efflux transporter MFP subunit